MTRALVLLISMSLCSCIVTERQLTLDNRSSTYLGDHILSYYGKTTLSGNMYRAHQWICPGILLPLSSDDRECRTMFRVVTANVVETDLFDRRPFHLTDDMIFIIDSDFLYDMLNMIDRFVDEQSGDGSAILDELVHIRNMINLTELRSYLTYLRSKYDVTYITLSQASVSHLRIDRESAIMFEVSLDAINMLLYGGLPLFAGGPSTRVAIVMPS